MSLRTLETRLVNVTILALAVFARSKPAFRYCGWRATFGRARELSAGGSLHYGAPELWVVGVLTMLSILALA